MPKYIVTLHETVEYSITLDAADKNAAAETAAELLADCDDPEQHFYVAEFEGDTVVESVEDRWAKPC